MDDRPPKRARHACSLHDQPSCGTTSDNPWSWQSGRLSDWTVLVGPRTYRLHSFILARGSLFFDGHTNTDSQMTGNRESDLTSVLPSVCFDAFEDALDYLYSEDQSAFEVSTRHAIFLMKIADVLGIPKLSVLVRSKIKKQGAESAISYLLQYCQFHIPGTQESEGLDDLANQFIAVVTEQFQSLVAVPELRQLVLQLPVHALNKILQSDSLMMLSEDEVLQLLLDYDAKMVDANTLELWSCVRWEHLGAEIFQRVIKSDDSSQSCQLKPEIVETALRRRLRRFDVCVCPESCSFPSPRVMKSPLAPPPSSLDVDLCLHYGDRSGKWKVGDNLRSETLRIGDFVFRLLVFPRGTLPDNAAHVAAFLEAVPQPTWAPDWKFTVSYSITCFPWSPDSQKISRNDEWDFRQTREDGGCGVDRGWHDFLNASQVRACASPDGFLMFRASILRKSISKCFL